MRQWHVSRCTSLLNMNFPNLWQNIMCVLLIWLIPPPPSTILFSLWHHCPCLCPSQNFIVILTPLHVFSSLIWTNFFSNSSFKNQLKAWISSATYYMNLFTQEFIECFVCQALSRVADWQYTEQIYGNFTYILL